MSLDDIIKKNRNLKRKRHSDGFTRGSGGDIGGDRGRSYGPGPTRRSVEASSFSRTMPNYSMGVLPRMQRREMVGGRSSENAGTVLRVSALSSRTSDNDVMVLFSDVGTLKWYSIHYDGHGVFKGVAEVAYQRHSDALEAIRRYHNMPLDGKPMTVVLKGPDVITYPSPSASSGLETLAGSHGGEDRTCLAKGHRKSRGNKPESISVQKLDAELDKYHREAMQSM